MLKEEGIKKRIEWCKKHLNDSREQIIECIKNDELHRVQSLLDKISETRGKIKAFELTLNSDDEYEEATKNDDNKISDNRVDLPDDIYDALWGGHVMKILIKGDVVRIIDTNEGVRGIDCKTTIAIKNQYIYLVK